MIRTSLCSDEKRYRVKIGRCCTAFAMLLALSLSGCHKKEETKQAPPVVEFVTVQQQDVPITTEWVGAMDGYVNAVIKPQVTGYLIKQNYKEGDLFRKGQALFEIDPRTFKAAYDQAVGSL
mgnify:CR=1 FL=1